ncbi:MAG TPA: NAD-dependent epimerase/dehydratase family protein [Thermoprotei archaeon]|nr:NAD-dependent epimerase/dehydratase family protein [Thermoprotei archaeon]
MSFVGDFMRVLVTGAAGFIGASLYIYLIDKGYEVVGIDSYERPSAPLLSILERRSLEVYRVDVLDREGLKKVLGDVDGVVHLAAYIDVGESMVQPWKYIYNNVLGTASILDLCREVGINRFIFISSASVYGDPEYLPIDEEHPLKPLSPYGYSKVLGEYIGKMYSEVYGMDVIILRLFNVYGFGQSSEYAGVIAKFIDRVLDGLPPVIYGDGLQTRDFIYVYDVCEAISLALRYRGGYEIFNIASGRDVSIRDLAYLIINLSGRDLKPIYMEAREGDIRYSVADISRARERLGFTAKTDLEDGIKSMLSQYMG